MVGNGDGGCREEGRGADDDGVELVLTVDTVGDRRLSKFTCPPASSAIDFLALGKSSSSLIQPSLIFWRIASISYGISLMASNT